MTSAGAFVAGLILGGFLTAAAVAVAAGAKRRRQAETGSEFRERVDRLRLGHLCSGCGHRWEAHVGGVCQHTEAIGAGLTVACPCARIWQ